MKKIILINALLCLQTIVVAQENVQITSKGETLLFQKKDGEVNSFMAGGKTYLFTDYYESPNRKYHMECFDEKGLVYGETELLEPIGVSTDFYNIREFVGLGDHAYAFLEHLQKDAGKATLVLRKVNPIGAIEKEEIAVMEYPFEKTLNSGLSYACTSPDQEKLGVVALLPYEKGLSAKIKVAVYDRDLKLIKAGEFTIPGEDSKNKRIVVEIANDGTVFVTKHETVKDRGIVLTVFSWDATTGALKATNECGLSAENRIENYVQAVNDANELVIAGVYYEFKNLVVGEQLYDGVFYFSTNGALDPIMKSEVMVKKVPNLESKKLIFNGNTAFFGASVLKKVRIDPPASAAGTPAALDYNYQYAHGDEFVFGFSMENGALIFEKTFEQSFSATNFHQQFEAGYMILNGEFTIIYNDLGSKYMDPKLMTYKPIVSVMVHISEEGRVSQPFIMTDEMLVPKNYLLFPCFALKQSENEIIMIMRSQTANRFVRLTVTK